MLFRKCQNECFILNEMTIRQNDKKINRSELLTIIKFKQKSRLIVK